MCGITGYTGDKPVNVDKMRLLVLANEDRGSDSTGIYGTQRFRSVERARSFVGQQGFETSIKNAKSVIAHTRRRSFGAIDKESTHPFKIGVGDDAIVGVHNGTIYTHSVTEIVKKLSLPEPKVDSEMIYMALHNTRKKKGELDFSILSEMNGNMALAFVYKGLLYLYHRDGRPLHYTQTSEGIYFSSEGWPLQMLGPNEVKELPCDLMHIFKDGTLIETVKVKDYEYKYKPSPKQESSACDIDDYPMKQKSKALPPKSNTSSEAVLRSDYWDKMREKVIGEFPNIDIENVRIGREAYEDHSSCLLFVTLIDSVQKKALSGWYVGTQWGTVKDNHNHITGASGVVGIRLTNEFIGTNTKLKREIIVFNPIDSSEYYSCEIECEKGRVLEVTLTIPFHGEGKSQTKTSNNNNLTVSSRNDGKGAKAKNKSGASGSAFHDGNRRDSKHKPFDGSQSELGFKKVRTKDKKGEESKDVRGSSEISVGDIIEDWFRHIVNTLLCDTRGVPRVIWQYEDGHASEQEWRAEMIHADKDFSYMEKFEYVVKTMTTYYSPTSFDIEKIVEDAAEHACSFYARYGHKLLYSHAATKVVADNEKKYHLEKDVNVLPWNEVEEDIDSDDLYSEAYEIQKDPIMTMVAGTSKVSRSTRVLNIDSFQQEVKEARQGLEELKKNLKSVESLHSCNRALDFLQNLEDSSTEWKERIESVGLGKY